MAKTRKTVVTAKPARTSSADKTIELLKAKAKARKTLVGKPKAATKPARPVPKIIRPEAKPIVSKMEPSKGPVRKQSYGKEDLAHFRKIIIEKKKEIVDDIETLRDAMMDSTTGEYTSESSTYSTHMEQGTDAMEREKTFMFASREGKFLNHLEDALVRIDRGDYGVCIVCGKLIEKERLEAVPHAQQCLQCKLRGGR